MKKICFVVSEPMTAKAFLLDHMQALRKHYEVTLVANFDDEQLATPFPGVTVMKRIPIQRNIRLITDLYALLLLYMFFRKAGFCAVHSVTPKAGLIAMVAARMAGVEHRFHTFTGQVWVGKSGLFRWLLIRLDRLIFLCATHVLVDSPSQRDFLVQQRVITRAGSGVLGEGSICGVNLQRFWPDPSAREALRNELGVPCDAFVFLFLGRVNRDKGVSELVQAFARIASRWDSAYLLVVGPEEDGVLAANGPVLESLGSRYVRKGFTSQPEVYMAAADVFCLPSYREGFGSVILEAASAGIPSIGSRIYGITDAIEDGKTGLLHRARDVDDLAEKMELLLKDRSRCRQFGEDARRRATERFGMDRVVGEMVGFYQLNVRL